MQFLTSLVLAAFVGYAGSWYLGYIEGNFALLLLLATVVTGIYWLAERFYFLPQRKAAADLLQAEADIAMPSAREEDGSLRPQPVFCLMRAELVESLGRFIQGGGRKIDAWTAQHRCVVLPFNGPEDDPQAFFNANTLAELRRLEAP